MQAFQTEKFQQQFLADLFDYIMIVLLFLHRGQNNTKIKYILIFEIKLIQQNIIYINSQPKLYLTSMLRIIGSRLRITSPIYLNTYKSQLLKLHCFYQTKRVSSKSQQIDIEQPLIKKGKPNLSNQQVQAKIKQLKGANNLTNLLNAFSNDHLDSFEIYEFIFNKLSDENFASFFDILNEAQRCTNLVFSLRQRSWDIAHSHQKILKIFYFFFKLWHAQKCKSQKNYFSLLSNDYIENHTAWANNVKKSDLEKEQNRHFFKGGYESRLSMILTNNIKNGQSSFIELGFIYFLSKIFMSLPNDHIIQLRKGMKAIIIEKKKYLQKAKKKVINPQQREILKQKVREDLHFLSVVMLGQRSIINKNVLDIKLKSTGLKAVYQLLLMRKQDSMKQIIQQQLNQFPDVAYVNSWSGIIKNLNLMYPLCTFSQHFQRVTLLKFYTKKVIDILKKNIPRSKTTICTNMMLIDIFKSIDQYHFLELLNEQLPQMKQLQDLIVKLYLSQLQQNGFLFQDPHQFSVFLCQSYRTLKSKMTASDKKLLLKYLREVINQLGKTKYSDVQLQKCIYINFVKLIYQQFREDPHKKTAQGQIMIEQWVALLETWILQFQRNQVTFWSLYYAYLYLAKKLAINQKRIKNVIDFSYLLSINEKINKKELIKPIQYQQKAFLYTYDSQKITQQKQKIKFFLKFYGLLNLLKQLSIKFDQDLYSKLQTHFFQQCNQSLKNVINTLFLSTLCFYQELTYKKMIQSEGYKLETRTVSRRQNSLELFLALKHIYEDERQQKKINFENQKKKTLSRLLEFVNTYKFYLTKETFIKIQKYSKFINIFNMVIVQKRYDIKNIFSTMSDEMIEYSPQLLLEQRNNPSPQSKQQLAIIQRLRQQIVEFDQTCTENKFKSSQEFLNGAIQIFTSKIVRIFPENIQALNKIITHTFLFNLKKEKISVEATSRLVMDFQSLGKFNYEPMGQTQAKLEAEIMKMDNFLYENAYPIISNLLINVKHATKNRQFMNNIQQLMTDIKLVQAYLNSFLKKSTLRLSQLDQTLNNSKISTELIATFLRYPKLHYQKYNQIQYFLDNLLVSKPGQSIQFLKTFQSCKEILLLINSFNVIGQRAQKEKQNYSEKMKILQKLQRLVERGSSKGLLIGIDKYAASYRLQLIRKYLNFQKPYAIKSHQKIFSNKKIENKKFLFLNSKNINSKEKQK